MEELYNRLKTGERLRNKRKKIGWSQERAAEMMNLSAKYYADIERGTCGMSIETLITLSKVYQMSADMILFGEESSTRFIDYKVENAREKVRTGGCPSNCSYILARMARESEGGDGAGSKKGKGRDDAGSKGNVYRDGAGSKGNVDKDGAGSRPDTPSKSYCPDICPLGEDYDTCNKTFLARSHADMKVFFNNDETGAVLEVLDNSRDTVREYLMKLMQSELEFSEKLSPTIVANRDRRRTSDSSKDD